jgi:hypothetical protein
MFSRCNKVLLNKIAVANVINHAKVREINENKVNE